MYSYATRKYTYVIRMSLVCHSYVTRMSFVYHTYISYVIGMYSYVIRKSLICGFTMNRPNYNICWQKVILFYCFVNRSRNN